MAATVPPTLVNLPSDQDASGRTLGAEEIAALTAVIASGTLNSTKGTYVAAFEKRFAEILGVKHAIACNSGSGAVHIAVAAIDPNPGDEIITTSITDMGALTPILYQGAIPVFADVDPLTYNVTAQTIADRITPRTRAIIVTHLFGNPCEMDAIMALANERGIPVIEDCAQAPLATYGGKKIGTFGAVNAFSWQQGKHVTTGEGGFVVTDDDALARRVKLLVNKAWGYGDPNPDHYFIALNYRMTELQGAVGVAQLEKLQGSVDRRIANAKRLDAMLGNVEGIAIPKVTPKAVHVYWKYCLRVDDAKIDGGAPELAKRLNARGIASAPRYIQKPAFRCEVFRDQRTFGDSRWPFTLASAEAVDYSEARFPGTFEALHGVLVLPWTERYTDSHVDAIGDAVRSAVSE